MTLNVEFRAGTASNTTRAAYRRGEFSLEYSHRRSRDGLSPTLVRAINERLGIREAPSFFAIADTLTLVFAGAERELVAVEAYTNSQRWRRPGGILLPGLSGDGQIYLADTFQDDRIDLGVIPDYDYVEEDRLLRVSLRADQEGADYYRVSDSLIVGVARGELVVLLIQIISTDEASGLTE
jgi:hypothetical protein